ncbi:Embryonic polarity protein dorsal, partial [Operophtera brumata]
FRYRRECRTNGSIPGISSTAANKIHPKIKVNNFVGPAIIRVSCVTKDAPHRPHPHKLVGKSNKSKGGECNFKVDITAENPMVEIKNIGIQCMKRDECQDSLQDRARKGIDPFRTGFGSTERIDLHSVRLAFELLPGFQDDEGRGQLPVVTVSNVISGTKSQLVIFDTCPPCGLTRGGDKMILLTEKLVSSDVLSVVFAEKGRKLEEIWKESVEITSKSVHKQHALLIETPPYSGTTTTGPIKVVVYLQRALTGDEAMDRNRTSNSVPYEYMPEYAPRNKRVSSLLLPDPE